MNQSPTHVVGICIVCRDEIRRWTPKGQCKTCQRCSTVVYEERQKLMKIITKAAYKRAVMRLKKEGVIK